MTITVGGETLYGIEPDEFEQAKLRWPRYEGSTERKSVWEKRVVALWELSKLVVPGDRLTTVMRHRSTSGMYRAIDVYKFECIDGKVERRWLSYWIAKAGIGRWDDKREAVGMSGAGMDMGFAIVYSLAHSLFRDGFDCTGERCPSNDHSNGVREYGPGVRHNNGGYALQQEWLG